MRSPDVSSRSDGYLDTNVVIHTLMKDAHSEECRDFLASVESGQRKVRLESYVVHEISYVLDRQLRLQRQDIVGLLLRIVQWPGIDCDRELLSGALLRWRDRPNASFVDALLAVQALQTEPRVFTINVKDFDDVGIEVPRPLWNYTP